MAHNLPFFSICHIYRAKPVLDFSSSTFVSFTHSLTTSSLSHFKICRRHTDIPLNDRAIYFSIIIFLCAVLPRLHMFFFFFLVSPSSSFFLSFYPCSTTEYWATWSRCRVERSHFEYHKEIVSRWKMVYARIVYARLMLEKMPSIRPINKFLFFFFFFRFFICGTDHHTPYLLLHFFYSLAVVFSFLFPALSFSLLFFRCTHEFILYQECNAYTYILINAKSLEMEKIERLWHFTFRW